MPLTHEFQCEIGDGFSLRMAHVKKDTHWYCDTQCYIFSNVKVTMDRLRTRSEKKHSKIGDGCPLHSNPNAKLVMD